MKNYLVALLFFLFASVATSACPCPTVGTLGDSAVVMRDITITAAIDFTGTGEPTTPVALGFYLSTSNVTKVSPAASFVKGQLYYYNAGNWELVLLGASSTGKIGMTKYFYGGATWEQVVETGQQYVEPAGDTSRYVLVPGLAFSATTPLAANATYSTIGKPGTNANGFFSIKGFLSGATTSLSDQPFTIAYDYSNDGVTVAETINSSYSFLNESRVSQFSNRSFQYLRITVTNGPTPMTHFMFALSLSTTDRTSASSLKSGIAAPNIAPVAKALAYGEDGAVANTYATIKQTSGALHTTITNTPSVTISENAKTAVIKSGTLVTTATTANQVVLTYTVTAGKTFYLQSLSMSGGLTAPAVPASVLGTISLETPSGTKVVSHRLHNSSVADSDAFIATLGTIPLPAGTVIRVVVTPAAATSTTWIANFAGYEQ